MSVRKANMGSDIIQRCIETIKKLTDHKYAKLTSSGNMAIFISLCIAKKLGYKEILIPDQGGWLTYKDYPQILGLKISEINSKYGIIDLDELKKRLNSKTALIFAEPAAYAFEQPCEEICKLCELNKSLLILDITGDIGNNPKKAGIMVCSFGKDKPINLGYGGFISTNDKELFEDNKEIFMLNEFYPVHEELFNKLSNLSKRMEKLKALSKKIKADLSQQDIIHKDSNGINVIVKYKNQKEKQDIINYCNKNALQYTECPRYIRINENAISIEVKRIV